LNGHVRDKADAATEPGIIKHVDDRLRRAADINPDAPPPDRTRRIRRSRRSRDDGHD
jgi:hypothetical protein